jgi:protein involved in polysaccharide export with SLBB domain
MKSKKLCYFSYFFLLNLFWQTWIYAQTPTPTPVIILEDIPAPVSTPVSAVTDEINLIHFGDLIDVDVIGSLEYDWRGTLNPEGFLDGIDFIENPIYAICRSEEEIAEEVVKAYSKTLREPKVVVKILDRSNRPLSILNGAVKTPHRFQVKRSIFLNELIIISGGLTETASGEIQIFRPRNLNCRQKIAEKTVSTALNEDSPERIVIASQDNGSIYLNIKISDLLTGKKQSNPQILSGDIVTVQRAESIYIIGGVANPKQISSRSEITISRAIASAGGLSKGANAKKIVIYRREGIETIKIEADLDKIKANQATDLILKANDIVEVSQTGRQQRKFPPILKVAEASEKNFANLPLRIID